LVFFTVSVLDFHVQDIHTWIDLLTAAGPPPQRSLCRFLDGIDASSFIKGFSKMVDIRNKVAAEPKVSAQYVDKEDRASFKGTLSV
jgi:hypothetical protein